ncbi:NADH-quinone oxidoreductase subunit A [Propioniciclava sp. MC1595]|uniref:NADH-quinone oxidoreductase subunit A n=1 Tax=unclassified Propioniciclava TaxID=2642922 RepID=UPI0016001779|nr:MULTISPECIES: NADH-quinone oxidoreductase subunit A [unclassified Propioniciclava]MBB1493976.1 NADH-quinone oxidoreductase subunit A [Propioniciclava sp. MC1595]MBB1500914.1 NADH-quinone oxidoreductase subunit A [Propioniciclava sp. MC1683]QTE25357.1 NADH-quinone oxidoreductase subunit A [Propioniciclava sp. MC1595]
MSPYVPILGVLFFSAILLAVMIVASLVIGPKTYNKVKYMPYECGIDPTPRAAGGGRFPVKYYITAMMFLVFDVEIAFLYPWVVAFDQLSMFAVLSMIVFLLLLCIAYYYEYKRGGMEWD